MPKFYMHQVKHQIFCEELVNYQFEDMSGWCHFINWSSNVQTPVKNKKTNADLLTLKWFRIYIVYIFMLPNTKSYYQNLLLEIYLGAQCACKNKMLCTEAILHACMHGLIQTLNRILKF